MIRPGIPMTADLADTITPVVQALDHLGLGAAVFDAADRTLLWNSSFLRLFPEHAGQVKPGEHYSENLRRFYRSRLSAAEMPHLERHVADGVARHQQQSWPFEFLHRGQWLRVASQRLADRGRLRIWLPIAAPQGDVARSPDLQGAGRLPAGDQDDLIADGLLARDAAGRVLFANRRFAALYGLDPAVDMVGRPFAELFAGLWGEQPGAAEAMLSLADNARFAGAPFELPLPGDRWVRVSEHRAADGSGMSTHVDITEMQRLQRRTAAAQRAAEGLAESLNEQVEERRRAEARLQASEQRMRRMLNRVPTPLICSRLGTCGEVLFVNRQFVQSFGYTLDDVPTVADWARRAYPDADDHSDLPVPWEATMQQSIAEQGKAAATEARLRCKDGTILDVLIGAEIMDDMALVSLVDITARKQAEEQQMLLAREVNHRAKNALAVVQAALRLTPKEDAAAYARSVEGRVTAIARVHNLLAADHWRGADLRAILTGELAPFIAGPAPDQAPGQPGPAGPRVDLLGAGHMLALEMVQPLAMVAHELATNAVKYGALSVPGGRVTIAWRAEPPGPAGRLRLRWVEAGGPPMPGPPERRGFGSRVIETTVERQLGGQLTRLWGAEGLICEIDVPLSRTGAGRG